MEPLGLPRGSVRSIIVVTLIVGVVILGLWGPEAAFTALVGILGAAVRDYFGSRLEQNRMDGPPLGRISDS